MGTCLYVDMRPLSIAQQSRRNLSKVNCDCSRPVFRTGGGVIIIARAIAHLGGTATHFSAGGATGEHLWSHYWLTKMSPCLPSMRKTGRVRTCASTSRSSGEQYRPDTCPAPRWTMTNFASEERSTWKLNPGQFWLSAAAFRPAIGSKLTQLISAAQKQGIRCIIIGSGDALTAALA